MSKKLYEFHWDCGRQGDLDGVFVAEESEVNEAIGKEVYFGEVLGKHSEVYGTLDEGDITIKSDDLHTIEVVLDLFDSNTISGFNPLEYIQGSE